MTTIEGPKHADDSSPEMTDDGVLKTQLICYLHCCRHSRRCCLFWPIGGYVRPHLFWFY